MASEFLISYMSTRMQSTTLLCKNMILRMKFQSSSVPLVHKKQQFQAIFRRFRILLSNKLEKCLRNSYSELSLDFLSSERKNFHTMLKLTVKDICAALGVLRHRVRAWTQLPPFRDQPTHARSARRFDILALFLMAILQSLEDNYGIRHSALERTAPALCIS